jgi:hypothetical protein
MVGPKSQLRPEDKVIESFVHYLADKPYPGLHITEWPDKHPGSRGEIDAIAEGMGKRVAIEHTSIDSLPNQRLDDARYVKVFVPLEQEFRTRSDICASISVPFGAVPTGVNWDAVREALRNWISCEVPNLANGTTEQNIDGVPFPITVLKPSSICHLWFARGATEDPNFADRLLDLMNEKAKKLARYKEASYLTILLIENSDIALMNRATMITAIETSYQANAPTAIDKVWYADTSVTSSPQFWNLTPASRAGMRLMSATEELENPPE